ncbi:MAG: galactokinase [Spirochaetales bacterium]|nr:galactokinase [Spirochaetales bacterium]
MEHIIKAHRQEFGNKPEIIVQAPGRINIIGDHTDYNDGYVFPMAIERYIWVALSRRKDSYIRFYSIDHEDRKRVNLQNLRYKKEDRWANYCKGVLSVFHNKGYSIGGLDMTVTGNIPEGAGLSSSAALEVATAFAIQNLFELKVSKVDLANYTQEAENKFVGVKCGIMDQFISILGRKGYAMFLDTRTLKYKYVPFSFKNVKVLITNSNVPRGLLESEYNDRRKDCEKCVEILQGKKRGSALRDYTISDLQDIMGIIPEGTRRKCVHVVEENQRVIKAEEAVKRGDFVMLGKLMNRSHESLRDFYEVSCPELDWLVKRAWETDGVYGSRMTGAGFGGCTVTLIDEKAIPVFEKRIQQYERIFGFTPEIYISEPTDGVKVIGL